MARDRAVKGENERLFSWKGMKTLWPLARGVLNRGPDQCASVAKYAHALYQVSFQLAYSIQLLYKYQPLKHIYIFFATDAGAFPLFSFASLPSSALPFTVVLICAPLPAAVFTGDFLIAPGISLGLTTGFIPMADCFGIPPATGTLLGPVPFGGSLKTFSCTSFRPTDLEMSSDVLVVVVVPIGTASIFGNIASMTRSSSDLNSPLVLISALAS